MVTEYVSSLDAAFRHYLKAKRPGEWEQANVSEHRGRIFEVLNESFNLMAFFQSGSFSNGTGIAVYSDVDYIARIHFSEKPKSSDTALEQVRDALRDGMWGVREITIDRPAVRVSFEHGSVDTEIVPAYLHAPADKDDETILHIPGPGGGWMEAAPKAHLAYVSAQNKRHDGQVKELARLLKAWKYEATALVSSFYLEMRAAQYATSNDSIYYICALDDILSDLVSIGLRDMNDPAHLVSRITACSYESHRQSALADTKIAAGHLSKAVEAWLDNDPFEMSEQLQAVLGSDFPTVYGDVP